MHNIPELLDPERNRPCHRKLPPAVADQPESQEGIEEYRKRNLSTIFAKDVVWDYYESEEDYVERAKGVQQWLEKSLPLYEELSVFQKMIIHNRMRGALNSGNVIAQERLIVEFLQMEDEKEIHRC